MKDASQISSTATSTTEPPSNEPAKTDPPATKAPDTYADFKAADGGKLDPTLVAEASTLFKESGLSQDSAQKYVDFFNKQIEKVAGPKALQAIIDAENTKYIAALNADPEIGGKLDQVKERIGRAYDAIGNPKLVADFKKAMDQSPEGNRPEFVKMLDAFASKIIEGKHVIGGGPSVAGQAAKASQGDNLASRMYPHLVQNRG